MKLVEVIWDFDQVKEGVEEIAIMLRLCLIPLNMFWSGKKVRLVDMNFFPIYLK